MQRMQSLICLCPLLRVRSSFPKCTQSASSPCSHDHSTVGSLFSPIDDEKSALRLRAGGLRARRARSVQAVRTRCLLRLICLCPLTCSPFPFLPFLALSQSLSLLLTIPLSGLLPASGSAAALSCAEHRAAPRRRRRRGAMKRREAVAHLASALPPSRRNLNSRALAPSLAQPASRGLPLPHLQPPPPCQYKPAQWGGLSH